MWPHASVPTLPKPINWSGNIVGVKFVDSAEKRSIFSLTLWSILFYYHFLKVCYHCSIILSLKNLLSRGNCSLFFIFGGGGCKEGLGWGKIHIHEWLCEKMCLQLTFMKSIMMCLFTGFCSSSKRKSRKWWGNNFTWINLGLEKIAGKVSSKGKQPLKDKSQYGTSSF